MELLNTFTAGACDKCGVYAEQIHDRTGLCEACYFDVINGED